MEEIRIWTGQSSLNRCSFTITCNSPTPKSCNKSHGNAWNTSHVDATYIY